MADFSSLITRIKRFANAHTTPSGPREALSNASVPELRPPRSIGSDRAAPGYSWCHRCGRSWDVVRGRSVAYRESSGMFAICTECWRELAPSERLPFYVMVWAGWQLSNHSGAQAYYPVFPRNVSGDLPDVVELMGVIRSVMGASDADDDPRVYNNPAWFPEFEPLTTEA